MNKPVTTVSDAEFARIRHGDRVTILTPNGIGRDGVEWAERTGRAVFRSEGHWVLNMGGRHGTPRIADLSNAIAIKFGTGPRARKERS